VKLKPEGDQEKTDADDPVELARALVSARVKHPAHVQHDEQHHQVRSPPVHVADDQSGRDDELQVLHDVVGLVRAGHVIKHEQHAGAAEDEETGTAKSVPARASRRREGMAMDFGRLDVEQETGNHRLRPLQIAFRQPDAKDGAADARACEPFPEAFGCGGVFISRDICLPPRAGLCPPTAGCPCSTSRQTSPTGAEPARL
jgi:hypothetical protein